MVTGFISGSSSIYSEISAHCEKRAWDPEQALGREGNTGGAWTPALLCNELTFKKDDAWWGQAGESTCPGLLPYGVDSLAGGTGRKKIMAKSKCAFVNSGLQN